MIRNLIRRAVAVLGALALTYHSRSWLVVTSMMLVMLVVMGPRHPRVVDETVSLGRGRRLLAIASIAIFALCFTPSLIESLDLIPR